MSEDVDGRQTRPADDVGRPDGSAKRAALNGRRPSWWDGSTPTEEIVSEAIYSCERALEDADAYTAPWIQRAQAHLREVRQRLRRGEAPHGQTPQDAEA